MEREPLESSPRERFAQLARRPDAGIDLAEGALLIAAEEYPRLSVREYLGRLDGLAEQARGRLAGAAPGPERVARLNHFLFVEQGFTGNAEDYYDARNSFLNDVIERRRGIPITLSVVYVAVARRLGLDAHGISFPGHFLAKVIEDRPIVVDPFNAAVLDEASCRERFEQAFGEEAHFEARVHLRSASARDVLVRMLSNLKQIHVRGSDFGRALGCCERILLLLPDAPLELRDRGLLYERLECHAAAVTDLERFLELAPDDPSATAVRARLVALRRQLPRLH